MRYKTLIIVVAVLMVLTMVTPALANPPFPEGEDQAVTVQPPADVGPRPAVRQPKAIDQPNIKDYLQNRRRQELMEAGQTARAAALAKTADDRVLVILVEFAGTDVFTWEAGVSTWDPYGVADPDENTGTIGDCSNIITQTTVFTYTGPLHNEMPAPVSPDDRSGDSIWTEDFSNEWFDDFMFGEGVVFDYAMQDGTPVFEDFTGQSVKDYYQDMSGGTYEIAGDVIGWLQVPHSTWYYDADECPGARSGGGSRGAIPGAGTARTLVMDALDVVNAISDTISGFDWANYDLDGDGVIDRLWIVHSGYGEEDSSTLLNRTDYGEAAVWSHSSSVSPPYEVTPGISAGPYIMMPENGGIGVFAHEAGHNLGADDLYAYGQGNTSAGFWTLMADDWTGHPIGFEPPAVDPWHLDNWGWLDPFVVTDPSQVYEVTLGQASRFPGGEDVYRAAKIVLPDGVLDLAVSVWQGDYYWWGGKKDLANAMMTTVDPIAIPAGGATLAFDLVYDIEDEWDFLWTQASVDGGGWDTLTNANTQCEHDPGWIGGYYGFPEDLCGAGLGGFYGYNETWPAPEVQEFDLSAYAGQSVYLRFWFMTDWSATYTGAFVDNVAVTADGSTLFEDDAESSDAKWLYQDPWQRSDGTMTFTHNYYLQWRNVGENGGYDSALGDERWRFGPANTGLLVWYNNNFYSDNEIYSYLEDDYGFGPKGRMLVVDSHPEPYRDPNVEPNWLGREHTNITTRGLMRDAPFTLQDTVDFTYGEEEFQGRSAASSFCDSLGYYPGVADEGDGTYWSTVDWDASVAMPALGAYSVAGGSAYPGSHIQYVEGAGWYGYWEAGVGGTGNPGDDDVQYGWHVDLIEEAADHTWGKVRIYNYQAEPIISEVKDTNVRDTSFTVSWITNISSNGRVNYGADPANLNQTAYDDRGAGTFDDTHHVTLLGLTPNTTYYFDAVSGGTTDDNEGSHYTVATGPTLDLPPSDTIYGQVFKEDGTTPAEGTIVYITLRGADGSGSPDEASPLSTLVDGAGYWSANLGNARLTDLSDYFDYSASGDRVRLEAQGAADSTGCLLVDTADDSPAADLILNVSTCPIEIHMPLKVGWNFVSLPVDPVVAYTAQSLCDEINEQGGDVTEVDRWYASGWDGHVCGLPFNNFGLELGQGYFVKSNSESTWTVEGWLVDSGVLLELQIGWNSIAIHHSNAYAAQSLCDEINDQCGDDTAVEVDRWYTSGWDGHICALPFNDFDIEIGKGYFVKSASACDVTPDGDEPVCTTMVSLIRDYNNESNMGNLVTDGMKWKADLLDDGGLNSSVDIAFTNPGGLRTDIIIPEDAPWPYIISWKMTLEVMPFGNTLFLMDLTGAQVQELLDQAAKLYKGILQTSGASWYWYNDCDCDTPTNWGAYGVTVNGEPLDPEATYRVVTNNFLAGGQDGWVTFGEGTNRWDTYYDMQEGVNDYIALNSPISPTVEGRILKLDKLITILHTNDLHGDFPTTDYYGTPEGVTYLTTYIKAERTKNPNALLIDAGDTFQGNAFAQHFRNATPNPIAGAMNLLEYDAMTLGNHEFNFGPTTFVTMLGQLDFPILGANVEDDGAYGFINDNVEDYITLNVDGVDVAILGLTNPRVPSYELPSNIEGLTFYPAVETAETQVPTILATEDPDLLIGLTHIGYQPYGDELDSDELVAQEVAGIDVIVGGHSHTTLDPAVIVTSGVNPNGTLVAQTQAYAQYLGKINVGYVSDGNGGYDMVMREGYLLPAGNVDPDPDLVAYLEPFEAELEAYTSMEIGQTTVPIDALEGYTQETNGTNLQVDASIWELGQHGIAVDFHLSGAMSNKKVADEATEMSPVTLIVDDMYTLMPYENSLLVMEMNGPQIKAVLERSYRNWWYYEYTEDYGGYSHYTTCMLDISAGGVITYNDTYPTEPDGNNVVSLVFNGTAVDFADAGAYYNVSTVNYLAAGSCNFSDDGVTLWPLDQIVADTQYYVRDAVIDYVTAMGAISPEIEGRLVFIQ